MTPKTPPHQAVSRQSADDLAAAGLVVEQARTLTQIEEARFAATQARITTLLAVSGVLAGLGGGMLGGITGQSFVSSALSGKDGVVVCLLVLLTGSISVGALVWSAATAIGALKVPPEEKSKAARLDRFLKSEVSSLIEDSPKQVARALVAQLAGQRDLVREATDKVDEAFKEATRLLGIAVASGLALSLVLLLAASDAPQEIRLVRSENQSTPAIARATLKKP